MIVEREPKKQNCLVCLWLNKTRLGLIGLNYIWFESTMPRTVHVIFVICIVRIDNSTCVETNGFLLYCCHCILVRSAIKSSDFCFPDHISKFKFQMVFVLSCYCRLDVCSSNPERGSQPSNKKYEFFSRFTVSAHK